jgi:hypothetical protein
MADSTHKIIIDTKNKTGTGKIKSAASVYGSAAKVHGTAADKYGKMGMSAKDMLERQNMLKGGAGQFPGAGGRGANSSMRSVAELNKKLDRITSSLSTLDKDLNRLTAAMKHGGGRGGGRGGGAGGGGGSTSALGSAGSAMPLGLGVLVAGAAFATGKMNEVANAYIAKISEQKESVGISGSRGLGSREAKSLASELAERDKAY